MGKNKLKTLLFHRLPPVAYAVFIFIQSAYPSAAGGMDIPHLDKVLHFCGYGLLGILVYRALQTFPLATRTRLVILLSIALSSLYGMGDEIHQSFVPERSADLADVMADTLGSAAGVLLYRLSGIRI